MALTATWQPQSRDALRHSTVLPANNAQSAGSQPTAAWSSANLSLRRQSAVDSEDTLQFSLLNGMASMNEIFPLEEAQAAYDRMMSGKARFRVALKVDP